jgi:hypothetical protein
MAFDVLILNSGEWMLGDELPAAPWHVLIYRQRGEPRNELHLWLPRRDAPRSGDYAFKRYWMDASVRWCVEVPPDADRARRPASTPIRVRFTAPDGRVLWSEHHGGRGLGDLSDRELGSLLSTARQGSYTGG